MSSLSVLSGETNTTGASLGGTDAVNVASGGAISVSTANVALLWNANTTGGGVTIVNGGTIAQLGLGAAAAAAIGSGGSSPTGSISVTNTGAIQSLGGNGLDFTAAPATASQTVTNSGAISGGGGVAIQFGAGDDVLNLQSGGSIVGRVDGGAGVNSLNLSGTAGGEFRGATEFNGAAGAVSFAGFDKFNHLNVNSGAWTLYGAGNYDSVAVASGATLVVDDTHSAAHGTPADGGLGALNASLSIVNSGTLVFNNADTGNLWFDPNVTLNTAAGGPLQYSGTGDVVFQGASSIGPRTTWTIAGPMTVSSGELLVLGVLHDNLTTIAAGASLQIGGGGKTFMNDFPGAAPYVDTGLTSSVTGSIVDNGRLKIWRLDDSSLTGGLTGSGALIKDGPGALTLGAATNFNGSVIIDAGAIVNAGAILTTAGSTAAVFSFGDPAMSVSVINVGTISSASSSAVQLLDLFHGVTLTNGGVLLGGTTLAPEARVAVELGDFSDTFTNSGTVGGAIHLGAGDDVLNIGTGSAVTGTIDGGAGVDTMTFATVRSDFQVSYSDGAFHVTDLRAGSPEGANTIVNVENFSFAGTTISANRALLPTNAAIGDFDGDGKADILWRNQASGVTVIWQMNGTHNLGGGGTDGFAGAPWTLLGTGDFNGDGKADLLWRNDTDGTTAIWTQNGVHLLSVGTTSAQAGNDWYVAGIADYNGDGKADVLWRNLDSSATVVWTMNGSTATGVASTDIFVPSNWSVAGSGDFNGDGKADILWRNQADGSTVIWEENGAHQLAAAYTTGAVGLPWTVAGVADFNGDGKADILWRNVQTDQTAVWIMNGATLVGGGVTDAFAPHGWSIGGTGDFNGDGKADILWRNDTTQQTVIWEMNAQHPVGSGFTDAFAPGGWIFT